MTTIDPVETRNAVRAAKAAARKHVVVIWDESGLHIMSDVRDARQDAPAIAVRSTLSDVGRPVSGWRIKARDIAGVMDAAGDGGPVDVTIDRRGRLCIVSGGVSVPLDDDDDDGDGSVCQVRPPRLDGELVASIDADGIDNMVRVSAAASSPKSVGTRRDLEYVYLARLDEHGFALGTDGHRMTIAPASIGNHSGDDGIVCAVPVRIVRALSRMALTPTDGAAICCGASVGEVSMTVGHTRWSWESAANPLSGAKSLVSRALSTDAAHTFAVTSELRREIRLAAWQRERGDAGSAHALTASGRLVQYDTQRPDDFIALVDPRKLAAALDDVNGVEVCVRGELDPIVVVGNGGRGLVMPCRR